jgi:hypothetical protein
MYFKQQEFKDILRNHSGVKNHKPVDSSLLEQFNIAKIEHNGIRQHFF